MSDDAPVRPANILVVDDTPANLQLLAGMLKSHGYQVRPVNNGELALRAVQAEIPDLILLDITMPDLDGYEVCRRLKADPRSAGIPVLFISALSETEDKTRAFQSGGVDYVSKPFQFEEVEARVRTHLELRRQREELEASLERLRQLESLRDSLTHMLIHDMKSPLGALRLSLDVISSQPLPETERRQLLATAQKGVASLTEMVSQILDVSRMDAGKMTLRREPVDLMVILFEVIEALKPMAGQKRLLQGGGGPVWSTCDADIIRRVISNLVGNALKFSPKDGKVRIDIDQEEGCARVSVSDEGPGIEASHQQRIFEKYAQVESPMTRAGTGLGLAFVKMAVEAHGGRISVQSEPGQGCTFTFTIPG